MTILSRVEGPGFELTVCGTPSKSWFDWLLTAQVPLTEAQMAWREIHRRNLGLCSDSVVAESVPARAADNAVKPARRFDLVDTEEL